MKSLIAAAIVASTMALLPITASAGERMNDAVMGGVSGLLVGGPVGAVAGGVIGYTAGPSIGRGMRGERRYHRRRNTHNTDAHRN
jgi:hypothetical protein